MPDRPHLQASLPPPNTPPYATLLTPSPPTSKQKPKQRPSSLPRPLALPNSSSNPYGSSPLSASSSTSATAAARTPTAPATPNKSSTFNFTQLLLSGVTGSSSSSSSSPLPQTSSNPRSKSSAGSMQAPKGLMSTRQPLSMGTTTVNFRRFVARSGVVFWLQDRVEEVLMWRRGWKVTVAWMCGYAFICWFPRTILLLPHLILLSILLPNYLKRQETDSGEAPPPPPAGRPLPAEGSTEWLANLQAIQNLMGFASDAYDLSTPLIPHLTHRTPYSLPLTRLLLLTLLPLLLFLPDLPLRPTFLVLGLLPFLFTHPHVQALRSHPTTFYLKNLLRLTVERGKNDDALTLEHWLARSSGQRNWGFVDTWEREVLRFPPGAPESAGAGGAGGGGTAGSGGRQWVAESGRSPFEVGLMRGWGWVEGEGWVCDLLATWAFGASEASPGDASGASEASAAGAAGGRGEGSGVGPDEDGWVYADEGGRLVPPGSGEGMMRRRRWTRRIWRLPQIGVGGGEKD